MSDLKKESCISKIKNYWKEIYNSPCFWLKAATYFVIALLVILGITTLVIFALNNFAEAISYKYMAPERLGQFGDFLGGTLNPLIGLATILLLIITLKNQQSEFIKSSKAGEERELLKQAMTVEEYYRKHILQIHEIKFQTSLQWLTRQEFIEIYENLDEITFKETSIFDMAEIFFNNFKNPPEDQSKIPFIVFEHKNEEHHQMMAHNAIFYISSEISALSEIVSILKSDSLKSKLSSDLKNFNKIYEMLSLFIENHVMENKKPTGNKGLNYWEFVVNNTLY